MADDDLRINDWTLTRWETLGLETVFNLADGHAQHAFLPEELDFISSLNSLLSDARARPQSFYEMAFVESFFRLAGQTPSAVAPLLHYSSSISIDVVAKALRSTGRLNVGVICPAFDNIPLLLRRNGLRVNPLREPELWTDPAYRKGMIDLCDAIFLVIPNNPTGFIPTRSAFLGICHEAASAGKVLAVDFSFRLLSSLHSWDQYEMAREIVDLSFIYIEDTGKVYPLKELKVGLVSSSPDLAPVLRTVSEEIALSVSSFALYALAGLLDIDRARAGLSPERALACSAVVRRNRDHLRETIRSLPLKVISSDSRISVEWLKLRSGGATELCGRLADAGVAVLPGRPFYWDGDDPDDTFIRVALAREARYFALGVERFASLISDKPV